MSNPPPLQYYGSDPSQDDISHLRVLSIIHYIWGGLIIAFSCIFIIYIVIGAFMASGSMNSAFPTPAPPPGMSIQFHQAPQQPPAAFGYAMIAFGGCAMIVGWAVGILTVVSGRRMANRKSRVFSIVIGGLNCISFPIGTVLGVFTIIVLSKQSVKNLYETNA